MKIGIHQPNYLPWIGYFNKMAQCDKFVIFDDVQLPTGKNFETKTTIKTANGPLDLIIPINHRSNDLLIKDAVIDGSKWNEKHLKTIKIAYAKAPFIDQYISDLEQIYNAKWSSLLALNTFLIKTIAKWLGIETQICLSSEIDSFYYGEDKILDIIEKLGGDEYISGTGAGSRRYINEQHFIDRGIKLIWQDFVDPVYPQLYGEFKTKLSALDLLMNVGLDSYKHLFYEKKKI